MDKNAIAAAIGNNNLTTLMLVEHLMRAERDFLLKRILLRNTEDSLAGMGQDELRTLARESHQKAKDMAEAGILREYCESHGLNVPLSMA